MAKRHSTLREEKNCLNCGHTVEDRYCSHCGQENLVIHDSALHMVWHYVQDLFHYDGRFWHTIKNLVRKPGQVPLEYIEGKRRNNIEPIKLYVFASTVFFLLFFLSIGDLDFGEPEDPATNYSQRLLQLEREKEFLKGTADTALINQLQISIQRLDTADTPPINGIDIDLYDPVDVDTTDMSAWSKWVQRRIDKKAKKLNEEHGGDELRSIQGFINELMHRLPQLLFVSMPFFALLLSLVYIGRRRRNYAEHFIFATYHYAYLFLTLIVFNLFNATTELFGAAFQEAMEGYGVAALFFYLNVYLLLSMKRFYTGRWSTLILRYMLLASLFSVLIIGLAILFFVIAILW